MESFNIQQLLLLFMLESTLKINPTFFAPSRSRIITLHESRTNKQTLNNLQMVLLAYQTSPSLIGKHVSAKTISTNKKLCSLCRRLQRRFKARSRRCSTLARGNGCAGSGAASKKAANQRASGVPSCDSRRAPIKLAKRKERTDFGNNGLYRIDEVR